MTVNNKLLSPDAIMVNIFGYVTLPVTSDMKSVGTTILIVAGELPLDIMGLDNSLYSSMLTKMLNEGDDGIQALKVIVSSLPEGIKGKPDIRTPFWS